MAESGRAAEIALYTGNDDHIVLDLIASYRGLRMVGGLLGQWAVWTRRAVEMLEAIHRDPGAPDTPAPTTRKRRDSIARSARRGRWKLPRCGARKLARPG